MSKDSGGNITIISLRFLLYYVINTSSEVD